MRTLPALRPRRTVATLALAAALATFASPAAFADGVHLRSRFWMGGCTVTYSLDQRAAHEYGANVAVGLAAITRYTGMTFVRMDSRGDAGAVRIGVVDELPSDELGLANAMGEIELADVSRLPSAHDARIDSGLRDRIVTHEMLHALGLDHDAEEWSRSPDELMNPRQSWKPLQFGAGDRAGMAYLRSINHCMTSGDDDD